jgi:putative ABC transport system permease protein
MMSRELRQALRSLGRTPTYAAVCVITFALVVGAAAGIFGAVDAVLLRSLPYGDPGSLVFLGERAAESTGPGQVSSYYTLNAVAESGRTLEDVAVFNIWQTTLTGSGEPARLAGAVASWNYFRTLRRTPAIGRDFEPGEGAGGRPLVVMISDRLWRQRFAADPGILGRALQLDGIAHQVIGVMPRDFRSPDDFIFGANPADIWRPVEFAPGRPTSVSLRAVARVKPGVTEVQVASELEQVRQRIGQQYAEWAAGRRIVAIPLQAQVTAQVRPVLLLLGATALLVLLVGCANLANLVLARGLGRAREVEVRVALGAGLSGAVRPLLVEVAILAAIGATAGVLLASAALDLLVRTAPAALPRLEAIGVDARVIAAAFAFALGVAGLACTVPLLRLRPRADGASTLLSGMRGGSAGRGHHRAQFAFAVAQMAFALAVLSGAVQLGRSLLHLIAVDPGYRAAGVYATQLDLPAARYADESALVRFTDRITAQLGASPAIASAGLVTSLPQQGLNNFSTGTPVRGRPQTEAQPWAHFRGIDAGYFQTMDIPLLRGRSLEAADFTAQRLVTVVNEEYARRFFPAGDVLGQHLEVFGSEVEVVGVVGSVKYGWPGEELVPEMYVPWGGAIGTFFLVVRASGDEAAAIAALRNTVHDADALLPVDPVLDARQMLADATAEQRFALLLLAVLAGIAVTLAVVGLYGVVAYAVSDRRREFGIRLAVGAVAQDVVALVMRRGAAIATVGALLGVLLASNGSALIRNQLFGVQASDPLTFIACTLLLVALALFACWRPARQAARVDPVVTLRGD